MIKKPITIHLSTGLEARPVAQLVQVASQFKSSVHVESGNKKVNAKSIMGMMLNPQVGKSGVNHRLRKLSEIADELRNDKEELL